MAALVVAECEVTDGGCPDGSVRDEGVTDDDVLDDSVSDEGVPNCFRSPAVAGVARVSTAALALPEWLASAGCGIAVDSTANSLNSALKRSP